MSIYDDIRAVLEVNLSNISGLPSVAWENVSFNPQTQSPYIRPRLVPTIRKPAVRGLTPQMYYQGYFLVECYTPENQGPSAADDLADLIMTNLEATTDISHNGLTLCLRYAERDLGTQEGAHYMVPVRIGWYLYQ